MGEGGKEKSSTSWFSLQMVTVQGLTQALATSLIRVSLVGDRAQTLGQLLLLIQTRFRGLGCEWMPASQAGVGPLQRQGRPP